MAGHRLGALKGGGCPPCNASLPPPPTLHCTVASTPTPALPSRPCKGTCFFKKMRYPQKALRMRKVKYSPHPRANTAQAIMTAKHSSIRLPGVIPAGGAPLVAVVGGCKTRKVGGEDCDGKQMGRTSTRDRGTCDPVCST